MNLTAHDLRLARRLGGVSLALQPGGITAICGPNGAGKSSLLQCLAGLLPPDAGKVTLGDEDLRSLHPRERARALLARVLAGEPRWILADEPLAALDLAHQLALLRHLRRASDEGAGVVLVLHDLALAMNHADRIVVLSGGMKAADGPPEEALSAAIVQRVWGVPAHWLGEPGARALMTG